LVLPFVWFTVGLLVPFRSFHVYVFGSFVRLLVYFITCCYVWFGCSTLFVCLFSLVARWVGWLGLRFLRFVVTFTVCCLRVVQFSGSLVPVWFTAVYRLLHVAFVVGLRRFRHGYPVWFGSGSLFGWFAVCHGLVSLRLVPLVAGLRFTVYPVGLPVGSAVCWFITVLWFGSGCVPDLWTFGCVIWLVFGSLVGLRLTLGSLFVLWLRCGSGCLVVVGSTVGCWLVWLRWFGSYVYVRYCRTRLTFHGCRRSLRTFVAGCVALTLFTYVDLDILPAIYVGLLFRLVLSSLVLVLALCCTFGWIHSRFVPRTC